ncbi:MAG: prepilin-type N-terminal cleavage/methylation domain-containing protein, partial [Lentisphaerae bacterium]
MQIFMKRNWLRSNFPSSWNTGCRSRFFSLIELLIVISIIAILAALLLPALAKARHSAMDTYCLNILKQLGVAIYHYVDENEDFFPYTKSRNNTDAIEYDDLLAGYDGRPELTFAQMNTYRITDVTGETGYVPNARALCAIYKCPVDNNERTSSKDIIRSYSMNSHEPIALNTDNGYCNQGIAHMAYSVKINQVEDTAGTIAMTEFPRSTNFMGGPYRAHIYIPSDAWKKGTAQFGKTGLHGPFKFNYLFCDGHA